jgi:hypothetical protein
MWDSAMQPNEFLTLFCRKKKPRQKKKRTIYHVWGDSEKEKEKKSRMVLITTLGTKVETV